MRFAWIWIPEKSYWIEVSEMAVKDALSDMAKIPEAFEGWKISFQDVAIS